MANDTNPKARAIAAFAEMFFEKARLDSHLHCNRLRTQRNALR